jgi:hypothetical protein
MGIGLIFLACRADYSKTPSAQTIYFRQDCKFLPTDEKKIRVADLDLRSPPWFVQRSIVGIVT